MSRATHSNCVDIKASETFYILPTFAHLTATQNILRCEVCSKCILPVDGKVENKINISWLETGIEDHPHFYNL